MLREDRPACAAPAAARALRACRSRSGPTRSRPRSSPGASRGPRASATSPPSAGTAITSRLRREHDGLLDEPLRVQLLRQLRVGGGVDVGLRALADLRGELVRASEGEARLGVRRTPRVGGEGLLQRCRGRHDERRARRLARASRRSRQAPRPARSRRARQTPASTVPRSTITDVALTVAVASTPCASPSSSTASRVIAAVTRCGPASISTSAITPSTRPRPRAGEAVASRQRVARPVTLAGGRQAAPPPAAGCSRRLRSSRDGAHLAGPLPAPQRVDAHADLAAASPSVRSLCLSIA